MLNKEDRKSEIDIFLKYELIVTIKLIRKC